MSRVKSIKVTKSAVKVRLFCFNISPPRRPLSRSRGDNLGTGESEIMMSAGDDGKGEKPGKEAGSPFPALPVVPCAPFYSISVFLAISHFSLLCSNFEQSMSP